MDLAVKGSDKGSGVTCFYRTALNMKDISTSNLFGDLTIEPFQLSSGDKCYKTYKSFDNFNNVIKLDADMMDNIASIIYTVSDYNSRLERDIGNTVNSLGEINLTK